MDVETVILTLRSDPRNEAMLKDSYLDEDVLSAAKRFLDSAEFSETWRLLAPAASGGRVVDLGAGVGIASYALARSGAREVLCVEPDPSDVVGRGAAQRACAGQPVTFIQAYGDHLPFEDGSVDAVYLRQVLHHVPDVAAVMAECYRVLRPGGLLLSAREHVAENPAQLEAFLASHVMHRMAGGESAWPRNTYLDAARSSGLSLLEVWGHLDSILNAFPGVRSAEELTALPGKILEKRLGTPGRILAAVPGVRGLAKRYMAARLKPGHMLSFFAMKP